MQDVLRDGFRRAGYRVLLTADPARALDRLSQEGAAAECALFDAQQIGRSALEAFNQLAANPTTRPMPAMLLLGEPQRAWKSEVSTAAHRVVLFTPITMKQLRQTLVKLLGSETAP